MIGMTHRSAQKIESMKNWRKECLCLLAAAGQKSRQRFRPENKAECCCSSLVTFGFIEERDYAGSGENSFLFTTGNTTAFFKEYSSRV